MFSNDPRTVLTLDAGGTNFVFTAIRGNKEITDPVILPSHPDNREVCLETIVNGFSTIKKKLDDLELNSDSVFIVNHRNSIASFRREKLASQQ